MMGRPKYSDEELLEDIKRVADELGHSPTWDEYERHGEYSAETVSRRFDGWVDAKQRVGLGSSRVQGYTDEELLEDLKRVAESIDEDLTVSQYNEHGMVSSQTIAYRFGSWNEGKRMIGLSEFQLGIADEKLLDDLRSVVAELGQVPTKREYKELGSYSPSTLEHRFGNWNAAIEQAGFEPVNQNQIDPLDPGDLFDMYYRDLMFINEIAAELGCSTEPVTRWFEEYGFVQMPKQMRVLFVNGPMTLDEFEYDGVIPQVLKFKLRKPLRSDIKTNGPFLTHVVYLPIHDLEEVVRVAIEDCKERLEELGPKSTSDLFSGHGQQFREALDAVRDDYGV